MKQIFTYTLVAICSMIVVFLIANCLAYWYECFKPMCYWDKGTKNTVIGFTITAGLINGTINVIRILPK